MACVNDKTRIVILMASGKIWEETTHPPGSSLLRTPLHTNTCRGQTYLYNCRHWHMGNFRTGWLLHTENKHVKVGLYFWRSQAPHAPHTPPRSALVRGISWRVPIGVSMRKRLSKKYKPTSVHKRWQKLNDFQDTGLNNVTNLKLTAKMNLVLTI